MLRRDFFKVGLVGAGGVAWAHKAWALKYYPKSSDKKWAVIYGTWCGTSRDAAVWICEGMGGIADVFDARENPDIDKYDHLVIGGSIRANATPKELQELLQANQKHLKSRLRGYFAVCGNMRKPVGPEHTKMFIDDHLAKLSGVAGLPSKVFLGRITKALMEPRTAKMMEKMEDYDNLKRFECMEHGRVIYASVK